MGFGAAGRGEWDSSPRSGGFEGEPLAGFAIGVTGAGRHEELASSLERCGARVHVPAIPPVRLGDVSELLRWSRTDGSTPLRRLVGQAVAETVDAITFTSAVAVAVTMALAAEEGLEDALIAALRSQVVAACDGLRTAEALEERGVPTVRPDQPRTDALVRAIVSGVPRRRARRLCAGGHVLELRGHAVVLDGRLRPIAPGPMSILRALARRPGHVVSRGELCGALPGRALSGPPADAHAVEMAVARLRRGLGRNGIVETVVKRGYRLACEPARPDGVL
ncbi:MAG: Uroporphyrinogen synthase [Streptosporangiaceae bacterium]|jgi:uroporphyrinogen-III synthase|nr:Uroporphyrinogen synthase [Streptosporangiaceae bacterium]